MKKWLLNLVTGGTETAEIVYEVRDETRVIAVEKGLQKADSVTIVYLQKQPAFSPQGELSCLGWEYLLWVVVFLFLAVLYILISL